MTILESLNYMLGQSAITSALSLAAEFAYLLWLVALPFGLHAYKKETNSKLDQLQSELVETKLLLKKLTGSQQYEDDKE